MCMKLGSAGSTEQVSLVSEDEQFVLVVAYSEVRRVAEEAYAELQQQSVEPK